MMQNWKKRAMAGSLAMALIFSGAAGLSGCGKGKEVSNTTQAPSQTTEAAVKKVTNPLTGEAGYREEAVGKRPVAVMINNAPPARPQWGLCSPDIVLEACAEGGVTRMMWLYADTESIPDKVGSIRSARHDFVELAEGMDAVFIHWGGSPQAYSAIKERQVNDIDGMKYSGKYFARDKSRKVALEHTGYTTGSKVRSAIQALRFRTDWNEKNASPFSFGEKARRLSGGDCTSMKASFSEGYNHTFRYQKEDGLYYNYMNSNKMVDSGGKQMAVTNVVVLYVPVSSLGDAKGRIDMNLSSGTGVYASNGTQEAIQWKKGDPSQPLKLLGSDGKDLVLNPGKSWIGFVPSDRKGKTVVASAADVQS